MKKTGKAIAIGAACAIAIASSCAALTGCSAPTKSDPPGNVQSNENAQINENVSNGTGNITMYMNGVSHIGRTMVVSLPENPTTGYTLAWKELSTGDAKIELKNDEYSGPSDTGKVGSGGSHNYTFESVGGPGTVELTFTEQHSWEPSETGRTQVVFVETDSDGNILNTTATGELLGL